MSYVSLGVMSTYALDLTIILCQICLRYFNDD